MTLEYRAIDADEQLAIPARLQWVRYHEQCQDAGLTCRRCSISRPTLRKWWRRYQEQREEGLRSHSWRRHDPNPARVTPELEQRVLFLGQQRKLGPRRILERVAPSP